MVARRKIHAGMIHAGLLGGSDGEDLFGATMEE